jgi:transposase
MNYFGILSRSNDLIYQATRDNINADFIVQFMDEISLNINWLTVIVLDNASVHTAKKVKDLLGVWEKRGLYLFFLPPYSPQLNIIERFWKELKEGWIKPSDYKSADSLFYAVNRIFAGVGTEYCIKFSKFNQIKI